MTAARFLLLFLPAMAAIMPLTGCSDILGYQYLPSYRYRITVEVNTPEGLRSGSSVLQVDSVRGPGWAPDKYSVGRTLQGDAVTVDLGRRGKLFMTLRDGDAAWGEEVMRNFVRESTRGAPAESEARIEIEHILALRGKRRLERRPQYRGHTAYYYFGGDDIPEFFTFTDSRRPATARWVAPEHLDHDFGNGVSLRQITVEITGDPVTQTITDALPWANDKKAVETIPARLPNAPDEFNQRINTTDFRRKK